MGKRRASGPAAAPEPPAGLAFLLSQVGFHSATRFAERLAPLDLAPPHVGILQVIRARDGLSQQALGETLGMYPSRLVGVLDELEQRGLLERRSSPTDRRTHALHLTDKGLETLEQVARIAREHQDALCAALDAGEQAQLASLLRRVAEQQGLAPGIHPGLRRLGGWPGKAL
jgi:DNA-binding MarR family transcriptional regulator